MKVIIAGSRTVDNYDALLRVMERCDWEITEVVSGNAYGADALGERWADDNNISVKTMSAEWSKYGKAAGMIRNKEMARYADAAIILWDGESRGAKNMLDEIRLARKPVLFEIVEIVREEPCTNKNLKRLEVSLPI